MVFRVAVTIKPFSKFNKKLKNISLDYCRICLSGRESKRTFLKSVKTSTSKDKYDST